MSAETEPALSADHIRAVTRAIAEMNARLQSPTQLSDLADAGAYSRYHFHRLFRSVTSTTPARFLTGLRMNKAKDLLAHSTLTVTEISLGVGYESLGTFTTQFTRLVGLSPGRFRRLIDRVGTSMLGDVEMPSSTGRQLSLGDRSDRESSRGRITIAGLFEADLPQGAPRAFGAFRDEPFGSISDVPEVRNFEAFAMSVPQTSTVAELAIGTVSNVRVGRARLCAEPIRHRPREVEVLMRTPTAFDPPIVSATAAIYFAAHLKDG